MKRDVRQPLRGQRVPVILDQRANLGGLVMEHQREQVVLRRTVLAAGLVCEDAQCQLSYFPPNKEDAGR